MLCIYHVHVLTAVMDEDEEGEYSFSRPQARRSGRSRQNTAKEKRKAALDRFKQGVRDSTYV